MQSAHQGTSAFCTASAPVVLFLNSANAAVHSYLALGSSSQPNLRGDCVDWNTSVYLWLAVPLPTSASQRVAQLALPHVSSICITLWRRHRKASLLQGRSNIAAAQRAWYAHMHSCPCIRQWQCMLHTSEIPCP